jgi:hypothetical protein
MTTVEIVMPSCPATLFFMPVHPVAQSADDAERIDRVAADFRKKNPAIAMFGQTDPVPRSAGDRERLKRSPS